MGLLAALHAVLVYALVRHFFDRPPALLLAGLALLWPPQLALGDPSGSEMLFATLMTGAILLLLRAADSERRLRECGMLGGAAGLLLGCGMLTKTMGIPVALVAATWLIIAQRRQLGRLARTLGPMLLLIVLVTGPWIATYQSHEGRFGFTSAGPATIRDGLAVYSDTDLVAGMRPAEARRESSAELLRSFGRHALEHPIEASGILADKALSAWYATQSGTFDRLLRVAQIPWLVLFLLGSAAVVQRRRRDLLLLAAAVVAVWGATAAALSIYRYMAPFFPLVVIVSGWAIREVLRGGEGEIWRGSGIIG